MRYWQLWYEWYSMNTRKTNYFGQYSSQKHEILKIFKVKLYFSLVHCLNSFKILKSLRIWIDRNSQWKNDIAEQYSWSSGILFNWILPDERALWMKWCWKIRMKNRYLSQTLIVIGNYWINSRYCNNIPFSKNFLLGYGKRDIIENSNWI